MLSDESGPDGTEEKELLPCGCLYDVRTLPHFDAVDSN